MLAESFRRIILLVFVECDDASFAYIYARFEHRCQEDHLPACGFPIPLRKHACGNLQSSDKQVVKV